MKATHDAKAGTLTLVLDLDPKGRPSTSGKTVIHATSGGNMATTVNIGGKPLVVGFNAYTKA